MDEIYREYIIKLFLSALERKNDPCLHTTIKEKIDSQLTIWMKELESSPGLIPDIELAKRVVYLNEFLGPVDPSPYWRQMICFMKEIAD
jgi:hypothetical protein